MGVFLNIAHAHDPRGDRRAPARMAGAETVGTLAADLPGAIDRGDIAIRFQPQVRLADGRITGVEALARWDHPLSGPIDAEQLFAAADRAGLAAQLSDHVQSRTLEEVATWPVALSHLDVAVNVTAADLARADFAPALLARAAACGLAPRRLCVEVTESAPIADLTSAAVVLHTLRDAGLRTAIDDLGVGHAGFAWLRALPFDRLKIDKSLIGDVAVSARGRALVRGIVALADAMAIDVVAEGVETREQREILLADGCGWFQGFLCAGALDSHALARLVGKRS